MVIQSNPEAAATTDSISANRFAVLVEGWRENGHGPLARRLALVVRSRIGSGLLRSGVFLPPERAIAAALAVSRSTVVIALDELRADGFLDSQQGRGTWVRTATGDATSPASAARQLLLGVQNLNLAASVPSDASHLPGLTIDTADLSSITPAHGYAPAGIPALREAIAVRTTALGLRTVAAQIHVTNGAQHALHLALGSCTKPGDVVAIEDPTYVGVFDLLDARGLRPLPIPRDVVVDGSERLAKLLRAGRARAFFFVGGVHSPTGRVRRKAELRRLARELDRARIPVIEDNTVADLVFSGRRPLSLAELCEIAPVVTVESTSKVAWGGLRVGWLRAETAVVERTVVERERIDFGTAVPAQILALRLLDNYDDLIRERRLVLEQRAKFLAQLLHRHLPEWHIETPGGGLSLWVDIGIDAEAFAADALGHGVTVAPGSSASRSVSARTFLRLCFDRPLLELEAAVTRLERAFENAR